MNCTPTDVFDSIDELSVCVAVAPASTVYVKKLVRLSILKPCRSMMLAQLAKRHSCWSVRLIMSTPVFRRAASHDVGGSSRPSR
jgi:hypothetical protein